MPGKAAVKPESQSPRECIFLLPVPIIGGKSEFMAERQPDKLDTEIERARKEIALLQSRIHDMIARRQKARAAQPIIPPPSSPPTRTGI